LLALISLGALTLLLVALLSPAQEQLRGATHALRESVESVRDDLPARVPDGRGQPPPLLARAGRVAPQDDRKTAGTDVITTSVAGIQLKLIPAGEFMMGSPDNEKDAATDEKPQHRVRITRPFYCGVYEVTQAQYEAVMGVNPSWFSAGGGGKQKVAGLATGQHPVERVSWLDAVTFCNKLSEREGRKPFYVINGTDVRVPDWNGPGYRLPTEAEWEYACRGGTRTTTRFSFGDDDAKLGDCAWFEESNPQDRTQPVGRKRGNGFGLFDMHGNVWEWCWDWYDEDYYKRSPVDDPHQDNPRRDDKAAGRVDRGGGWDDEARDAWSANRDDSPPDSRGWDFGFRLVRGQSGG
jgi:formylglycine-generating enzyme required for sulfatase activity